MKCGHNGSFTAGGIRWNTITLKTTSQKRSRTRWTVSPKSCSSKTSKLLISLLLTLMVSFLICSNKEATKLKWHILETFRKLSRRSTMKSSRIYINSRSLLPHLSLFILRRVKLGWLLTVAPPKISSAIPNSKKKIRTVRSRLLLSFLDRK